MTYVYGEAGFEIVLLAGVTRGRCGVTIPSIGNLHHVIALHLVMDGTRSLNGPEMRFLRTEIGLTPETFAKFAFLDVDELLSIEKAELACAPQSDRLLRLLWLERNKKLNRPRAIRDFLTRIQDAKPPAVSGRRILQLKFSKRKKVWIVK